MINRLAKLKDSVLKIIRPNNIRIRILQLFNLVVVVVSLFELSSVWILLGFASYVVLETLGGNIGLHRYFCHQSFKTSQFWHKILLFFSHYIAVGSVLSWVGQHRFHHQHADTSLDAHSFKFRTLFQIIFGIWHVRIEKKMIRDCLKDNQLVYWHKNYWVFHLMIILSFICIDTIFKTRFLFSLYSLPATLCLISGYVLAIITHWHGYKTYQVDDFSTNSWIANLYTLGEGWHNNHHANPLKLRQGEKWWEWDLPAFLIEKWIKIDDSL